MCLVFLYQVKRFAERLRNDLFCIERDLKPQLSQSITCLSFMVSIISSHFSMLLSIAKLMTEAMDGKLARVYDAVAVFLIKVLCESVIVG